MTPKKEIFFRAHGIGALMVDGRGTVLTDKMGIELEGFEKKIKDGGNLTPTQRTKMLDLQKRRDTTPELSDTAKSYVEQTWLFNEKGFRRRIKSPYLEKGIMQETESLSLLSDLDGVYYAKNLKRETKDNMTGECDIKTKISGLKYVDDIKSSWDALTFLNSDWDKLKEWQGRTYLKLYDGDVFRLRFCLVDALPHVVKQQQEWLWKEFFHDSMTDEEAHRLDEDLKPMMEQIERNLVYTTNPAYCKEERVKTYEIERDDTIFKQLEDRIEPALEYYSTIKLNQLVGKYSI